MDVIIKGKGMSVLIKGAYPPIDCESCSYRGVVKCSPNYHTGIIPTGCPVIGIIPDEEAPPESDGDQEP